MSVWVHVLNNLAMIALSVNVLLTMLRFRAIERDLNNLFRNNRDLALWIAHHDPDLYAQWQQRKHHNTN